MSSDEIEGSKRFLWIIYIILQQFVAIIIGYAISITFDGNLDQLWLWHKVFTPTGVIFIMFEGILAFSPYNHVTSDFKKTTLNNMHGCFMGTGLTFMTVGISFAYVTNDKHFTSLHGIVGLIAWILCVISAVGGILTLYSNSLRGHIRPIYLRFCHTLVGLTAFLTSLTAGSLGFYKLIKVKEDEGRSTIAIPIIITLIVLVGTATLLRSGRTVVRHTKTVLTS
ncbi:hypothetical protein HHI36_000780 [Cryptolaemus montrouzieri]|uniref:ascorbate ferrireductase (transmembrane) n=1 Tax=Cryptolaemus montrouzieri TaxID=559131 RepID=A0ABD2P685_9CUCU